MVTHSTKSQNTSLENFNECQNCHIKLVPYQNAYHWYPGYVLVCFPCLFQVLAPAYLPMVKFRMHSMSMAIQQIPTVKKLMVTKAQPSM
jgi:hypothetical protein